MGKENICVLRPKTQLLHARKQVGKAGWLVKAAVYNQVPAALSVLYHIAIEPFQGIARQSNGKTQIFSAMLSVIAFLSI